jgi:hypothetical protein
MLLSREPRATAVQGYSVTTQQCFLSEFERQERIAARGDQPPPEPAELFFEAGLALALPLILALAADLWLAAGMPGS